MQEPATTLSVCVRGDVACVRVTGRANFTSSVDFKKLVQQLRDDGCRSIILDLGQCMVMDSTFLGVLARLGRESEQPNGARCNIELFNPTERVIELLDNLGVMEMFRVVQSPPTVGRFEPVPGTAATRRELNETCFEAHKMLMDTSPENERRFKDAAEFFARNLRKQEGKE